MKGFLIIRSQYFNTSETKNIKTVGQKYKGKIDENELEQELDKCEIQKFNFHVRHLEGLENVNYFV
jgi:hypothetical protein